MGTRDPAPSQVLTFALDAEMFGVDILRVREIRGWSPVSKIPQSPSHVLGVLNLRGCVLPVVDLRSRLGLPEVACTPLTVIIVLSIELDKEERPFGLVVDRVSDVIDIDPACLRDMPTLDSSTKCEFVQRLAVVADQMLMLLNIDELMAHPIRESSRPATLNGDA